MSNSRDVPANVERQLWAESMGYCMAPNCENLLIQENSNIGEKAHIIPYSEGGDQTFENLILLCSISHKIKDGNRDRETIDQLRLWKKQRNKEIRRRFQRKFLSFEECSEEVIPILQRNSEIFKTYGPKDFFDNDGSRHKLWRAFENEIISNNSKLELIFEANCTSLFPEEHRELIRTFIGHSKEFDLRRVDPDLPREILFPIGVLSMFGLDAQIEDKPPLNLSALQNFISHLISENRYIDLELFPNQRLI